MIEKSFQLFVLNELKIEYIIETVAHQGDSWSIFSTHYTHIAHITVRTENVFH